MNGLEERVLSRFSHDEAKPSIGVVQEYVRTVSDRLKIRLGSSTLPPEAGSIVVEACMKALRLRGFEGSTSESANDGGGVSTSFVNGILDEFEEDIAQLRKTVHKGGIRFMRM